YQRFFTAKKRLPPDWARRLATVDYGRRLALVAEHDAGDGPELVGVARWDPTDDPATAEVAVVVEDRWQNQGLGTALLADLLRTAGARGISRFRAWVLADNARMLRLLARVAEVRERHTRRGVTELLLTRRHARVPLHESEDPVQFVGEIEGGHHGAAAKKGGEAGTAAQPNKVERFGQNRLAGLPRWGQPRRLGCRPWVVTVAAAQESDLKA